MSESDFDFITDDAGKKVTSLETDSVYDGDRQSVRAAKVLSHGKFIDNSSVTSSHTTIESNTTLDYWDVSNQRGIMRLQTLRFRKIGNMGKGQTLDSCQRLWPHWCANSRIEFKSNNSQLLSHGI